MRSILCAVGTLCCRYFVLSVLLISEVHRLQLRLKKKKKKLRESYHERHFSTLYCTQVFQHKQDDADFNTINPIPTDTLGSRVEY